MGITAETHPPDPDEESLPLYTSLEHDEYQTDPLTLPSPTASPDTVRDFLVRLLTDHRNLPQDHARRIASRWTLGTGHELFIYSPSMYLSIFGPEDGWVLYKELKVFAWKQREGKKQKGLLQRNPRTTRTFFLVIWIAVVVGLGISSRGTGYLLAAAMFFVPAGPVGLLLITEDWNYDPGRPGRAAEAELYRASASFRNNN